MLNRIKILAILTAATAAWYAFRGLEWLTGDPLGELAATNDELAVEINKLWAAK